MSNRKQRFRIFFPILMAAISTTAFMATGVQANWLFLENAPVEVGKHSEDATLLVEGVNIQFLCKKIESENVLLEEGTATAAPASGKVLFNECTGIEKSTGKEQKNCNPINQPIKAAGKALIILHTNGQNYMLIEPNKNSKGEFESLTVIEISELCALTENNNVKGSFVLECGELNISKEFIQEDCKNYQVTHLLRQAPEALFPTDVLKYGVHKAALDGIAAAVLTGAFKGDSWSGEV